MHVRCPHCRNPIELVSEHSLSDCTCDSCGSSFSLVDSDETRTFRPDTVQSIAHFELRDKLGMGAFGTVWKAHDTELDRTVALKLPRKGQLTPTESEQFLREARAAAQLKHPGIISVHEVGREDDTIYIVSDFVDGLTLTDWLTGQNPTARETAELCVKIAKALHHAHENGVIHRDLKPGNIMLDRDGEPHIMDFGLAKRDSGEITMTTEGQILGTPAYMSPEQAGGDGHNVDCRSDVFSLGVILFELLTGERPFRGNKRMLIHQVLNEDAPSPRKLNSTVPRDLETVCLKSLRREPDRRYTTAKEVAEDLQRWLESKPILARPVGWMEKALLWCRRRPSVAGSAVAILLVACAVGGVLYAARLERLAADQENLRERVRTAVAAMSTSRGILVPFAIQDLEADGFRREWVIAELQSRWRDSKSEEKLGLAYALARFGNVRGEYLLEQLKVAPPTEAANLVTALRSDSIEAKELIAARIEACNSTKDWQYKARLSIAGLCLGDYRAARTMCRLTPDPVQRTIFIEELSRSSWDPSELAESVASVNDPQLVSALCLGIGSTSISRLSLVGEALAVWEQALRQLYLNASDSGTHSAAGYALRRLELELPSIDPSRSPHASLDWHVNRLGMTMLRMPAGRFDRKAVIADPDIMEKNEYGQWVPLPVEQNQTVALDGFWISDREVSLELFERCINDPKYADAEELRDWVGAFPGPTSKHPVQSVSWNEAVLFCNWLSQNCDLAKCYERVEQKKDGVQDGQDDNSWRLIPEADGYRLPTEAEWEYACRAGTTTDFHLGDDAVKLGAYCTHVKNSLDGTSLPGSRLCNGWGLFDMHGNVREWCHSRFGSFGDLTDVESPLGASSGMERVVRNGGWNSLAVNCRSSVRSSLSSTSRDRFLGFRVAATLSSK